MVDKMDEEDLGIVQTLECEAECPKEISQEYIRKMNGSITELTSKVSSFYFNLKLTGIEIQTPTALSLCFAG